MADFDPDAYLASKPAPAFDPDAYLGTTKPKNAIAQGVGNVAAGLVRGAGSIGATLLSPRDALEGFIARQMGAPELAPQDRRAAMDSSLEQMGADPDSLAFQGSKLLSEVAGTAGAGGGLVNISSNVAPRAAAAAPGAGDS